MNPNRVAAFLGLAVVAVAVLAGLWLAGSPAEQRLHRFDLRRTADLRSLVRMLDLYRQGNDALPEELEALVDGRIMSRLPEDPETSDAYEYRRLSSDAYELCARFSLPAPESERGDFWYHDAGRQCYRLDAAAMPAALERLGLP
ncbi:MAG TPA: hypothetical protein VGC50_16460 [Gammaproteobacteria bacterium]